MPDPDVLIDDSFFSMGACLGLDPDLFFPARGEDTSEAKAVCRECAVQGECLEWSIAHGEKFGIWGGASERERRKLRRSGLIPITKKCRTCGQPFAASNYRVQCCSDACRKDMRYRQQQEYDERERRARQYGGAA